MTTTSNTPPPQTSTCRHCAATITRQNVAAQWRDATMSGGCPAAFWHQPVKVAR
ncbi:hypothetical protein O7623_00870 [Solwaraspora sp. WMMD791]|uniref:hypothetical protein n=1 Tax=Solwaraspora sp. WMMD791 TaxID=3016086 RepID=UPI00249CE4DF|nr:hypothetical protein [Solwaraspora sp. WMMD791]WFE27798.1 hypothetical protein O7623_00870 [Solwaraspora sp. WMMD791]